MRFVEIGMEEDHAHFLVQGVPDISVSRIVMIIKSITAKQIFKSFPKMQQEIVGEERYGQADFMQTQ